MYQDACQTERGAPFPVDGAGRSRRFVLPGGECLLLALRAGDQIRVTDEEGLQPCAVWTDPSPELSLGFDATEAAGTLEALLLAAGESGRGAQAALGNRSETQLPAMVLLGAGAAPGATRGLTAQIDCICLLFAPGTPMAPDEQTPPTALRVELFRGADTAWPLPSLLATPKQDLAVPAATARAYRVAAGDYIQIIDVAGRQASDFLAFDAAALERGTETGLDATATRTITGVACPGPGLHAKFYDTSLRPLVEVVRDTVGRHDTFALACSAKYYDEIGYPGHANCTDNFNAALKPFGIAPRMGWPAINFFYNTQIDAAGTLGFDEPWSRPGDYVLLRALTDLVCASSSCADDVDASNAWTPTDIHVRVYDGTNAFSKGIVHRMTPDADPVLTRETKFHPRTAALTRHLTEYRGFWLPERFTGSDPIEEYWACRERAAIMDLSALRKFEITGPDAEALLQRAVTRDIRKLAVGQVVYTALCHAHGGLLDDATIFRMTPTNFRVVCGEDFTGLWLRQIAAREGFKAWVRSSTDQLHNVAVQGPRSRDILARVIWTPPTRPSITELRWFRFTIGRLGGPEGAPVVVSRTGYTGELGFEIWCHPKDAPVVWDAVMEAGQPDGLLPIGLAALDMLRIEAGLVFAGYEFCDQTDPFEAGIGFTVATKDEPCIGHDALLRRREHPQRKLVGLIIESNESVSHGDCVHVGRPQVGIVTSFTRSPALRANIALCRLDVAYATEGTEVEIGKLDGHQKRIRARVVRFPHYDPEKTRVRA